MIAQRIELKRGETHTLYYSFDAIEWAVFAADLKTGNALPIRVRRASDGKYLKSDGTWVTPLGTLYTATEVDSTNMPGLYSFAFAVPDTDDAYVLQFWTDSVTFGGNFPLGSYDLIAVQDGPADRHKMKAVLCNKQQQTIATGVLVTMDDDEVTPLMAMTPAVDDLDNPTVNILTPS